MQIFSRIIARNPHSAYCSSANILSKTLPLSSWNLKLFLNARVFSSESEGGNGSESAPFSWNDSVSSWSTGLTKYHIDGKALGRKVSPQKLIHTYPDNGGLALLNSDLRYQWQHSNCLVSHTASFCSAVVAGNDGVKEFYDKIHEAIKVKRSAPPNVWLWSLVERCKSRDDIKLLFDALQKLRVFRLSNLQIHENFNLNLCQEVAKACVRAGAVDYGMIALWKHNVYGLSPTIGSVNHLLSHAKIQEDVKLMVDILRHLKKSNLSLQPATADIVFSICCEADRWDLMSKYSRRFVKAGVKLRKTTIDTWMEFASKRGDIESLWKIEKSRSHMYKQHTIKSGLSCAKGFLLERKPSEAAAVIQDINQNYPDTRRQDIINELQKLVCLWPSEVVKSQAEEDRKALIDSLKADIPVMLSSLSNLGVKSSFNLEDLNIGKPLGC